MNDNLGGQFNCEKCGKPLYTEAGYSAHPECDAKLEAKQKILMDVGLEQLERLHDFPKNWIHYDKEEAFILDTPVIKDGYTL